jgi:hypothetical protein
MVTFGDIDKAFAGQDSVVELISRAPVRNHVVSYRIGKSVRSLRVALNELTEKHKELVAKYSETDEEGKPMLRADSPGYKDFIDELGEFLKVEVLDMKIYPVDIESLGDTELPPAVFEKLWFLFEEPES